MKKSFLLSAMLIGASAFSVNAQEVVFDFSNPAELGQFTYTPLNLDELQGATYTNASDVEKDRLYKSGNNHVLILECESITKDGVSITMSNPDKYKDYPRFFFGLIQSPYPAEPTAADFYCDLRWYQKEELKFTAPEGKKFDKIVMYAVSGSYPARQNNETLVMDEVGKQTFTNTEGNEGKTVNTWEADGAVVTEVTFKGADGSATQMAYSIIVTLSDNAESAITEIADENNAPVEYFDLTGVKHNAENLTPGFYVARQGNKTFKVLVK